VLRTNPAIKKHVLVRNRAHAALEHVSLLAV
jgi:hypothetical protein